MEEGFSSTTMSSSLGGGGVIGSGAGGRKGRSRVGNLLESYYGAAHNAVNANGTFGSGGNNGVASGGLIGHGAVTDARDIGSGSVGKSGDIGSAIFGSGIGATGATGATGGGGGVVAAAAAAVSGGVSGLLGFLQVDGLVSSAGSNSGPGEGDGDGLGSAESSRRAGPAAGRYRQQYDGDAAVGDSGDVEGGVRVCVSDSAARGRSNTSHQSSSLPSTSSSLPLSSSGASWSHAPSSTSYLTPNASSRVCSSMSTISSATTSSPRASPRQSLLSSASVKAKLDAPDFNVNDYFYGLVRSTSLKELLNENNKLASEIKHLDGDMQMMVYENYEKFITATDTVKRMKVDIDLLESDVSKLTGSLEAIKFCTDRVDGVMLNRSSKIEKLVSLRELLIKMRVVFSIPSLMIDLMNKNQDEKAIKICAGALPFLSRQRTKNIYRLVILHNECTRLYSQARRRLRARLEAPLPPYCPSPHHHRQHSRRLDSQPCDGADQTAATAEEGCQQHQSDPLSVVAAAASNNQDRIMKEWKERGSEEIEKVVEKCSVLLISGDTPERVLQIYFTNRRQSLFLLLRILASFASSLSSSSTSLSGPSPSQSSSSLPDSSLVPRTSDEKSRLPSSPSLSVSSSAEKRLLFIASFLSSIYFNAMAMIIAGAAVITHRAMDVTKKQYDSTEGTAGAARSKTRQSVGKRKSSGGTGDTIEGTSGGKLGGTKVVNSPTESSLLGSLKNLEVSHKSTVNYAVEGMLNDAWSFFLYLVTSGDDDDSGDISWGPGTVSENVRCDVRPRIHKYPSIPVIIASTDLLSNGLKRSFQDLPEFSSGPSSPFSSSRSSALSLSPHQIIDSSFSAFMERLAICCIHQLFAGVYLKGVMLLLSLWDGCCNLGGDADAADIVRDKRDNDVVSHTGSRDMNVYGRDQAKEDHNDHSNVDDNGRERDGENDPCEDDGLTSSYKCSRGLLGYSSLVISPISVARDSHRLRDDYKQYHCQDSDLTSLRISSSTVEALVSLIDKVHNQLLFHLHSILQVCGVLIAQLLRRAGGIDSSIGIFSSTLSRAASSSASSRITHLISIFIEGFFYLILELSLLLSKDAPLPLFHFSYMDDRQFFLQHSLSLIRGKLSPSPLSPSAASSSRCDIGEICVVTGVSGATRAVGSQIAIAGVGVCDKDVNAKRLGDNDVVQSTFDCFDSEAVLSEILHAELCGVDRKNSLSSISGTLGILLNGLDGSPAHGAPAQAAPTHGAPAHGGAACNDVAVQAGDIQDGGDEWSRGVTISDLSRKLILIAFSTLSIADGVHHDASSSGTRGQGRGGMEADDRIRSEKRQRGGVRHAEELLLLSVARLGMKMDNELGDFMRNVKESILTDLCIRRFVPGLATPMITSSSVSPSSLSASSSPSSSASQSSSSAQPVPPLDGSTHQRNHPHHQQMQNTLHRNYHDLQPAHGKSENSGVSVSSSSTATSSLPSSLTVPTMCGHMHNAAQAALSTFTFHQALILTYQLRRSLHSLSLHGATQHQHQNYHRKQGERKRDDASSGNSGDRGFDESVDVRNKHPKKVRQSVDKLLNQINQIDHFLGKVLDDERKKGNANSNTHQKNQQKRLLKLFGGSRKTKMEREMERLFAKREPAFSLVEIRRSSSIACILRIALRSWIEVVREEVFVRNGVAQLQLDCSFMIGILHLFVENEEGGVIEGLLDEVVVCAAHRCCDDSVLAPLSRIPDSNDDHDDRDDMQKAHQHPLLEDGATSKKKKNRSSRVISPSASLSPSLSSLSSSSPAAAEDDFLMDAVVVESVCDEHRARFTFDLF